VAAVAGVGVACALYSFYYDPLRLPPRLPFGTFGLVLGGDVLPLLVAPLLVGVLLLGQRPGDLGFRWPGLRSFALHSAIAWLLLLPWLLWLSRRPEFQAFYPSPAFPPAREHAVGLAFLWLLHHAPQLFATEFCFRGFLLQPLARGLGPALAIALQTGLYLLLHASKPPLEMAQATWGGVVFAAVAWRTRSFLPAFAAHWAVAVTMDALCFAALHPAGRG
jgi:membrane protease YdiL (CAAX protease family)